MGHPAANQTSTDPSEGTHSCNLLLAARDKMGNACIKGEADVTCGYLSLNEAEASSSSTDLGNGTYMLRWWASQPGECKVFIKLDGQHVLGSPALMRLADGPPPPDKARELAGDPGPDLRSSAQTKQWQKALQGMQGAVRPIAAG